MQGESSIAFKEWAVVCAALASGRQTIILRKGGIDEGRDGFRVKHGEFWLLPTRFHQDETQIVAEAQPLLDEVERTRPEVAKFRVDLYAVVEEVFELRDLAAIVRLQGEQILTRETIEQRFHYRRPGLFVLAVRVYRMPRTIEIVDSEYIAGCKSWVDLPESFSKAGGTAVMAGDVFEERMGRIRMLLADG
jgi:hypothetical protein